MDKKYLNWINKNINKNEFKNKNIFITGGNSGIGLALAKYCAYLEANVFLLCRSKIKAESAIKEILESFPYSKVEFLPLDLASLNSIKECAELIKKYDVDMFINNAGVYHLPKSKTADGFEITMGTNFLGTYYLNNLLIPYFQNLGHTIKVCFVSSLTSKYAHIDVNDLFMDKKYNKMKIYSRSKQAMNCVYYHYVEKNIKDIYFVLSHPGVAYTPLIKKGYKNNLFQSTAKCFMRLVFHSPEKAALSPLYGLALNKTCTIGPKHLFGAVGYPHKWKIKKYKKMTQVIEKADELLYKK